MQRLAQRFPLKRKSNFVTSLCFSKPVFSFSTVAAVDQELTEEDTGSLILSRLFKNGSFYRRGFAKSVGRDPEFKSLVSGLGSSEIDEIIWRLLNKNLESALDFFYLLKNDYGFKHSRASYVFVARVLATRQRPRALKIHLRKMVEQEGIILDF